MTPISSLLEACNVGHLNSEPLTRRWQRGLCPRSIREIIFGVGLNNLSDYFEERIDFIQNPTLRNVVASVVAGMIAGYVSHVPHNLSTLKLMEPQKSYPELISELIRKTKTRVPTYLRPTSSLVLASGLALVFPRGLGIRTTQIVGSFIILNGTIHTLKDFSPFRRDS